MNNKENYCQNSPKTLVFIDKVLVDSLFEQKK